MIRKLIIFLFFFLYTNFLFANEIILSCSYDGTHYDYRTKKSSSINFEDFTISLNILSEEDAEANVVHKGRVSKDFCQGRHPTAIHTTYYQVMCVDFSKKAIKIHLLELERL